MRSMARWFNFFSILTLAMSLSLPWPAKAQTQVDYPTQIQRGPLLDMRTTAWTRTNLNGASGSLASAGAHTIAFTRCPQGLVAGTWIRVVGAPGATETVSLTSTTCNLTSMGAGNIVFTTANSHTSYTLTSATLGAQEASNVLAAAGGGMVHCPSGTHQLKAAIRLGTSVLLQGPCTLRMSEPSLVAGPWAVGSIQISSVNDAIVILGESGQFGGLMNVTLDGGSLANTGGRVFNAVAVTGRDLVTVRGVDITGLSPGTANYGVRAAAASRLQVDRITVNGAGGGVPGTGSHGIYIESSNSTTVTNSLVADGSGVPITLAYSTAGSITNNRITRSTHTQSPNTGAISIRGSSNVTVSGNNFQGTGALLNPSCVYIESLAPSYAASGNTVVGNTCANARHGVFIGGGDSSGIPTTGTVVTGNTFASTGTNAVWITSPSNNTTVTGNIIRDAERGVYVLSGATNPSDIVISSNVMTGITGNGVESAGSTINLTITDNNMNGGSNGVLVTAGTVTYLKVTGNRSTATIPINIPAGAFTIGFVEDNPGSHDSFRKNLNTDGSENHTFGFGRTNLGATSIQILNFRTADAPDYDSKIQARNGTANNGEGRIDFMGALFTFSGPTGPSTTTVENLNVTGTCTGCGGAFPAPDNIDHISDNANATRRMRFIADLLPAGTSTNFTFPAVGGTFTTLENSQTLTGLKTFNPNNVGPAMVVQNQFTDSSYILFNSAGGSGQMFAGVTPTFFGPEAGIGTAGGLSLNLRADVTNFCPSSGACSIDYNYNGGFPFIGPVTTGGADLGRSANRWQGAYVNSLTVYSNIFANGIFPGLNTNVTVATSGGGTCSMVFTMGILTSETCP